jgi:hypothetical protein
VSEARICNDAALLAAEQLAQHGIVESGTFDRLMSLLLDAQAALDKAHAIMEVPEVQAISCKRTAAGSRTDRPSG